MQGLALDGRLILGVFLVVIFKYIKYKLYSFYEINNRLESVNIIELFAIASDIL